MKAYFHKNENLMEFDIGLGALYYWGLKYVFIMNEDNMTVI